MSFMDKITSRPRDARAEHSAFESQFDDVVTAYPEAAAAGHAGSSACGGAGPGRGHTCTAAAPRSARFVHHLRGHAIGDGR